MSHPIFISRAKCVLASIALIVFLSACGGDKPEAMLASARDYLAKNDTKAAVIQLKNALQKSPDLPEARYLLGLALFRGGDVVGSETELRKALALKHPQELVIPVLAQAILAQGQYKKLTDEFGKTELTQATARAELQTSLAAAYGAQNNGEMAKAALGAALAADPAYAPALIAQARQKAAGRDFDAALVLVDSILVKAPSNQEALKLKGDILLYGKNQPDEGLAAYRKAVASKPDFAAGHAAILTALLRQGKLDEAGKQLEEMKKTAANNPQTKYFETLLAFQKKDFKLARDLSQQLIKVAPNNLPSLQLAGAIELQANSLLQAEAYLSKALQIAPDAPLPRRMLVALYLRSGQAAKALATLQPALKGDDLDVATNGLAGEVYLQNGDTQKAEEFFAKATKQDPKNTRARTALALTHLVTGNEDAALGELQDIAASDSGTTADMALISANIRSNDFDKALKAIDALEKKQPDKPLAANLRGRVLLAKQDIPGARKSFERSVSLDPSYFPSVASLAALDLAEKKPDDARKRFEAVLSKNPKNSQALLALAELRARSGGTKEEVAELITRAIAANPLEKSPRLLLIELHLRSKDYKQALSVAQNAVAAVPDSPELLDALGRAQQLSGDANQALTTFNKVAAMQPLSPLPQMRLAEANMAAKDKDAAASSLRKALEIKPDFLDAQKGLIALAMDGKNYAEATAIARNMQKQRPKEPVGFEYEGDIAASQKKWDPAIEAYRTGLKSAPYAGLAIKLHSALGVSAKTAEQEKFAAGWLKDNPKDVVFRLYFGDLATARKDFSSAEKFYANVIQIQPNNAVALNNLAWVTGRLGKDGAVAYAEKANALAPDQPAFMDTLAMLLSGKDDYAKALEWQTKAIALQPQNNAFKLNLVKIYIKGGKKDLARKELDELAKLGDKFPAQGEVASLLKTF
jgi:putative PEP-CTERM system TPR-repeat lipoprotein